MERNQRVSDYEKTIVSYYKSEEVHEEIARFSRGRWVALHCDFLNRQGYQVLLRYQPDPGKTKVPLTVKKPTDVPDLVKRFKRLRPRTFYASANLYKELAHPDHVKSVENIAYCMPTWDVDNVPEKWEATLVVAKEIIGFLEKEGVSKSVFSKWSGKGAHVHIHERAFSENLHKRINPLDAAYAVVEYVNQKLGKKYAEVTRRYQAHDLSVENEMDLQRVFTCPLSLHRSLNLVAVCISTSAINNFVPEWADPKRYRHWKGWDMFEAGEVDKLAEKAYRTVGPYPFKAPAKTTKKRKQPTADLITKWVKKES